MALMVGQEDGSPVATSVQQELDVNREPFRIQEGVKLTSHTYCQFLKRFLEPWVEYVPLSRLRNLIYMHDNAPSHAVKATTQYLESIGWSQMIWPLTHQI